LLLRQATKVLERFQLRTDKPSSFNYKKISNYLSKRLEIEEDTRILNLKKAVKEFTLEVEFDLAIAKAS
ncbi:hypothetical protein PTT_18871, partial [Pyrenophora teres f. teres 0-1]